MSAVQLLLSRQQINIFPGYHRGPGEQEIHLQAAFPPPTSIILVFPSYSVYLQKTLLFGTLTGSVVINTAFIFCILLNTKRKKKEEKTNTWCKWEIRR